MKAALLLKLYLRVALLRGHFVLPSQTLKQASARFSSVALFARNFFKHPSMLGSIVPSSPFLVKDLMAQIAWDRARLVVEFGPGVGTITREVLKRMRPDAVLVVIELNPDFVKHLSDTISDPRLRVVYGSAADVRRILIEQGLGAADYIISSIPYSIMPGPLRQEIIAESRLALKPQGSLLVFQYTRTILPYLESSFSSVSLNFQLFNILPALIFHCTP
jgi:phospholipid N-methyltransferase